MTPIERAARALCENPSEDPDELVMMMNGQMWPRWRAEVWRVQAVLTAIREPSEEMETAGVMEGDWNRDNLDLGDEAKKVWSAMIDAALKEG